MHQLLVNSNQNGKSIDFNNSEVYSYSQIKQFLEEACDDENIAEVIRPLLENDIMVKNELDKMQNDNSQFLRKIKVDASTGEPFYCVPIHKLVEILQQK